ncbi:unnamed protein product [Brassica oleracea]|uniref:(rape) hypothetical protein n=1 Tax=Brassica napus TaxID=3708 RepID=A0A816J2Z6_BRANA|nr:unnamed protein product [Brassica napus]
MEKSQRWSYVKDKAIVSNLAEQEWENSMDGEEEDVGDEDKRKRVMERARGAKQRFCQQCSSRMRLAEHNERIRKVSGDSFGERSGRRGFSCQLIQTQERNKVDMKLPMADTSFKRP